MNTLSFFFVKKRTLLAVAGTVWMIAGFNVSRMGLISYSMLEKVSAVHIVLSLLVFTAFASMFYRMSVKHTKRIQSYREDKKPFWYFFDIKSYAIMIFMMGGGIMLRSSKVLPEQFIAVFYTGLGFALALAGVSFWYRFFSYTENA